MCLPNFIEFKQIERENALIGYRRWINFTPENELDLYSENMRNYHYYKWNFPVDGPHIVLDFNSGLYAYNYNYNYYNNYHYNYNNYNNYNYHYNYYNYKLSGIIKQWGKTAIHKTGQRSEFASVDTLFLIRENDAKGPEKFLNWIEVFNNKIRKIAEQYEAKVINWQDFIENQNDSK